MVYHHLLSQVVAYLLTQAHNKYMCNIQERILYMSGNLQSHTASNSKILEIQAIGERNDE